MTITLILFAILVGHVVWVVVEGNRATTQYRLEEEIRQLKKKARGE